MVCSNAMALAMLTASPPKVSRLHYSSSSFTNTFAVPWLTAAFTTNLIPPSVPIANWKLPITKPTGRFRTSLTCSRPHDVTFQNVEVFLSSIFDPRIYKHLYLAPLSRKNAMRYASRLVDAMFPGEDDRQKKVLDRLYRSVPTD